MPSNYNSEQRDSLAKGIAFGDYRVRIFTVTWLAYAGFYFCRKNFSVAMPLLKEELQFTGDDFKWIIFAYSLSYMLGQFISGVLSDRHGPRLVVGFGLTVAVVANLLMGFCGTPALFLLLGVLNGGGQSTGWSGTIKNMAPWYARGERGVVMAWWATCYVLGSFLATRFAAWCISPAAPFESWGWKQVFWLPSVVLAAITLLYIFLTRNCPSDVGLPELDEFHHDEIDQADTAPADTEGEAGGIVDILELLSHSAIWITGAMYFLLKLTRYAILFWAPLYLVEHLELDAVSAGMAASWYDFVGFFGAVFAGYVSDRLFQARRFPVASLMLLGLAVVCYFEPVLVRWGPYGPALAMSLLGFMTYGPDTLMTGAGAIDIGTPRRAATAAGVINGMGSCGQLLSPFVVFHMEKNYGWDSIFYLFVGCSLLGALLLATKWNFGGKQ